MGYASGLGASLGVSVEATAGTEATGGMGWYEILDHSLQLVPTYLDSAGLKVGQAYKRGARTQISRYDVNGDIQLEFFDRGTTAASGKGMGFWLKQMLGQVTVTQVTGAAYKQIAVPAPRTGLSFTAQAGMPQVDASGTVVPMCVDEQTEILTQRGWITHHSLDAADVALTIDPETREIRWEPVMSVHRFDHDGPLTRWKSGRMDALTTSNHRWLVETGRGRERDAAVPLVCPECGTAKGKRGPFASLNAVHVHRARAHGVRAEKSTRFRRSVFRGKPAFRTTGELADRWDYIITGGGAPACFASAPIYTDEFVELVGWVVTEGHYNRESHGVVLAQNTRVNLEYTARIRALAAYYKAEGATVSEYVYGDSPTAHWYFGLGIAKTIRSVAPLRQLTPEFLCALTVGQAQLLYRTLIDGDGSRRVRSNSRGIRRDGAPTEVWSQKDQGRIDGFQMLAAMLGKRTWAHADRGNPGCSGVAVHRDSHCVGKTMPASQEDYIGVVWCPRTRPGTWLARRNGCTYWTGNTFRGMKVAGWEFSCADGQLAQLKLTLDGWMMGTGTSLVAPTFAGSGYQASIFSFVDVAPGNFTIGGTATTSTGTAAGIETSIAGGATVNTVVKNFTLSGTTPLAQGRYGFGNAGIKREQYENGIPTITGTLEAEWTSRAEFFDPFVNNTSLPMQIKWTHYLGGVDANNVGGGTGANPYLLSFVMPQVKIKTSPVKLNGPDLITQTIGFEAYDDGSNPVLQAKIVSQDQAI